MDETRGMPIEMPSPTDLEDLYRIHVPRLERLARALTGDPDLAQDLAHEAFIKVAGRFGHLRDGFDAYLRKTLVNLARSHYRRLGVERRWLARQDRREPLVTLPDDVEHDALFEALRALPYRQRAAVALRYLEDLSEEQTADALGCSPRAVNGLVSRALASLREQIRSEP